MAVLGELHGKGVDLYLHQQGIDTTTLAGKALFGMMGVFTEFERAMVQERVNAGLVRARIEGKRLGARWCRPRPKPRSGRLGRFELAAGVSRGVDTRRPTA